MIEAAKMVQPKIAEHRSPIRRQFCLNQQISRELEEVRLEEGFWSCTLGAELWTETVVESPNGCEAVVFSATLGLSLSDDY
jgi:hypothetical protein